MAGDKTYITDDQGKLHRATRVHAVTPTDIVWSSNPNDYTVQVKIDGKWHRAVLTMDAGSSTFFDNINIDKALVTGTDGKQHTALIVKPESTVTLSDIKTDTHGTIAGTTTGETAVSTYSENWSNVKWQDNVNVYKVLVTGSDGKVHTALLTTSAGGGGGVQVIVLGASPLLLPDAIANSLSYVKAFGGTIQKTLPDGYTELEYIESDGNQYIDLGLKLTQDDSAEIEFELTTSQATKYVFGARISDANNNNISLFFASTTNKIVVDFNNSDYSAYRAGPTSLTTGVKYKALLRKDDRGVYDGSTTVVENLTACADNIETAGNAILFNGFYNAGALSVSYGFTGRVYSCKLANKRNLIPCKNPNNVVGMYDTVSDQFFTNAGTGDFVAGPETNYGVPSDYKALEYITFTGTQYLDTLITSYSNDNVLKVKLNPSEINNYPVSLQYPTSGTNDLGFYMGSSRWYFKYGAPSLSALASANTDYTIEATNGRLKINGVTQTGTVSTTITMSDSVYIGAGVKNGSVNSRKFQGKIYYFRIEDSNGNVLFDGIPAKDVNNVVGMYDTVSGRFLTNKGTGVISAGPVVGGPKPSSPQPIYCNNGVLKYSANIANVNAQTALLGYYISAQGVVTADANNWIYQDYIPVSPNTTYTLTMSSPVYYVSISEYSTPGDSGFVIRKAGSTGTNTTLTITTGATTNFIRFGTNIDRTEVTLEEVLAINWQLNKGNSMPYQPYVEGGLYTDGTVETINVHGKNLNGGGALDHQGYTSTGGTSTSTTFCGTLWKIKVKPGEKYTISYGNFPDGISGVFINTWLTDGTWNLRQAIAISGSYTYTVPAGVGEVNFTLYKTGGVTIASNSWLQVEAGETATAYEPYYDGGSATAEMLLKVGNYQDEQEILSGVVTRKVGIKVLDGTENWQNLSNYYNISKTDLGTNSTVLPSASLDIMCTHYKVVTSAAPDGCMSVGGSYINFRNYSAATLTDWTNWLAAQYAAGTPVILIYAIPDATETVTGQTLQVQSGNNTVEIVQAGMDGLQLEAEYTKVA